MTPKKNLKKSKTKPKKTSKKKAAPEKKVRPKKAVQKKRRAPGKSRPAETIRFERKGLGADSAGQSGALQGLSTSASADSESVDELFEEGNAFEAEVVEGVQHAPDADRGEVHTHELEED